ncbi:MAG TPA: hypothetical protein VGP93_06435 [Polyangiaceae bacterium]|nr:hypothetical protein [Polyangiaceae bacterium]
MKPLNAGSEIDAWCTKCRMDLGHRIVALVKGVPKRVVCLTCGSQHNYRAPKTAKNGPAVFVRNRAEKAEPKPTSAGARVAQRAKSEHERYQAWAAKTLGQAVDAFTRYSMELSLAEGQLVSHPKFGEGYVDRVIDAGKVSIMFRDGVKTLAHRARQA